MNNFRGYIYDQFAEKHGIDCVIIQTVEGFVAIETCTDHMVKVWGPMSESRLEEFSESRKQ